MVTSYGSGGDPARSLALLWRTQEPTSRRSKPNLTVAGIVRVASKIADSDGIGALSMRKVAEQLGVGTMSLYTYVPGKGELTDLMLDAAYAELLEGELTGDWRDRLSSIAHANWQLYLRHPWILQVARGRLMGPNAIARYERELSAVDGIGLTDLEMESTVHLINSYTEGAAQQAVAAGLVERESGMSDGEWWQTYSSLLGRFIDDRRFPLASRVGSASGRARQELYSADHEFTFGLERILAGVQDLVDGRSGDDTG